MIPSGLIATATTTSSGLTSVLRNDPSVTTTLWVSGEMVTWSKVPISAAADQTGVPAGFTRIEAQIPTLPGETRKFYQFRFAK